MQPLDSRTLLFVIGILNLLLALVYTLPSLVHPHVKGPRKWALGSVLMMAGFVLLGLENKVGFFVSKLVSNTLIFMSLCLIVHGLEQYIREQKIPNWLIGVGLMELLGVAYYSYVEPLTSARVVITSMFVGVATFYSGWIVYNYKDIRFRAAPLFTSASFFVISLVATFRGTYFFLYPTNQPFLSNDWVRTFFLIVTLFAFIGVGFGIQLIVLSRAAETLEDAKQVLETLALTDPLTGVNNRRYFFELAKKEFERRKRTGTSLVVMLMDIDKFKSINDRFTHQMGDAALRAVAKKSASHIRLGGDTFSRIGGEEFAAILPETSLQDGYEVAERLRKKIEALTINNDGQVISLTVSIGVTQVQPDDVTIEQALQRADRFLYKAKKSGRNQVQYGPA